VSDNYIKEWKSEIIENWSEERQQWERKQEICSDKFRKVSSGFH
jgi:hypothetical protein